MKRFTQLQRFAITISYITKSPYLGFWWGVAPDPGGRLAVCWVKDSMRAIARNADALTSTSHVRDTVQEESRSALRIEEYQNDTVKPRLNVFQGAALILPSCRVAF